MVENALDPSLQIDHEGWLRLLGKGERIVLDLLDLLQNSPQVSFFFEPELLYHRLELKRGLKRSLKKALHVLIQVHVTMPLAKDLCVQGGKPSQGFQVHPEVRKTVRRNVP